MKGYLPHRMGSGLATTMVLCLAIAAACSPKASTTLEPSEGASPTSQIDASPSAATSPTATDAVELSERPIDLSTLTGRIAFSAGAPNAGSAASLNQRGPRTSTWSPPTGPAATR